MIVTRFAPSPTGLLHVGNIRTALFNFLIARQNHGEFILRIDDTDRSRSSQKYIDAIRRDLSWLGLEWDRFEQQSLHLERYHSVADKLRKEGKLYECFESRDELALKRKLQLKMGKPPIYDRDSLKLTELEKSNLQKTKHGYWRYLLSHSNIHWDDGIQGRVSISTINVSDPVLIREDGQYLYTFASVVDDFDMGVTDIVRGSDHITNTAVQIDIMMHLQGSIPNFIHHSLLVGSDGSPLSKRDNSLSIDQLRENGIEPIAVLSQLASLGSSRPVKLFNSIEELISEFSFSYFNNNPTRYDTGQLTALTMQHYRSLEYTKVASRISNIGVPLHLAEQFWNTLRSNITRFDELQEWWNVFAKGVEINVSANDKEFVDLAMKLLPPPPYDDQSWTRWTQEVKRATGRDKVALYMPLRLAITGFSRGPSMNELMPLMQTVSHFRHQK